MFILASRSPRRQQLLKLLIDDFEIIVPNIDENISVGIASDTAKTISKFKAYKVFASFPKDTVLACDTIVVIEGELLGKPKTQKTRGACYAC